MCKTILQLCIQVSLVTIEPSNMFSLRNKLNNISELQTEYDRNMTAIRKQQEYLGDMGNSVISSINNYFQEVSCCFVCLFVCLFDC